MNDSLRRLFPFRRSGGNENAGSGVLLIPSAPYHLDEMVPLADALSARGVGAVIALERPMGRYTGWGRTQNRLFRRLVAGLERRGWVRDGAARPGAEVIRTCAAMVVMNDWGWRRDQVEFAQSCGIPTFAKVEGVQDFTDVDTGRERSAYRAVDHVLFQGRNDEAALTGRRGTIVGNCRIERILARPPSPPSSREIVVNCNFTYNVLTEHRGPWLASVEQGCDLAGRRYVISRHAADRGWVNPVRVSRRPVEELLAGAGVLVSRFSTLGFEALARGVEFVYHNPHGELVPTFREPGGAFTVTRSAEELAAALRALPASPSVRERAAAFLSAQIDVEPGRPCEERAADAVLEKIRG